MCSKTFVIKAWILNRNNTYLHCFFSGWPFLKHCPATSGLSVCACVLMLTNNRWALSVFLWNKHLFLYPAQAFGICHYLLGFEKSLSPAKWFFTGITVDVRIFVMIEIIHCTLNSEQYWHCLYFYTVLSKSSIRILVESGYLNSWSCTLVQSSAGTYFWI